MHISHGILLTVPIKSKGQGMKVLPKSELHSSTIFEIGKIQLLFTVSVCVALFIKHAILMRHIVACPLGSNYPRNLINGTVLDKLY
jgi:hypothetical protein